MPPDQSHPPNALADKEYLEIEAAVMETVRGRLFLAEHARRIRQSETQRLYIALNQLRRTVELNFGARPVRVNASFSPMLRVSYGRLPARPSATSRVNLEKLPEIALVRLTPSHPSESAEVLLFG
jgi:hypothetical protein